MLHARPQLRLILFCWWTVLGVSDVWTSKPSGLSLLAWSVSLTLAPLVFRLVRFTQITRFTSCLHILWLGVSTMNSGDIATYLWFISQVWFSTVGTQRLSGTWTHTRPEQSFWMLWPTFRTREATLWQVCCISAAWRCYISLLEFTWNAFWHLLLLQQQRRIP